jgi:hypothetical protein
MKQLLLLIVISLLSYSASAQWERIGYPGGYYSIYQFDSAFFAVSYGGIYRSTDDGLTWTDYSAGLPKTEYFQLNGFYDYAGVFTTLWSSQSDIYSKYAKDTTYGISNRDDTWKPYSRSQILTPTQRAFGFDTLINLTYSPDSLLPYSIYVSIDSGKSWQKRTNDLPDADANGYNLYISKGRIFAAINSNDTIIYNDSTKYVQQKYEGYYYSDDLGLHWKILTSPDSNLWWQYLYFPSKDQMYCISMYTPDYRFSILRSADNGTTWLPSMNGIDTGYNSSGIANLHDFGDKMFLALRIEKDSTDTLFCYSSDNKGSSWNKISWFTKAGAWSQGIYKRVNRNDGYIITNPSGYNGYLLVDTAFRFVSDFDPLTIPLIANIARVNNGHIISYNNPKDSIMESFDHGDNWNRSTPLGDSNVYYSEFIGEGKILIKRTTTLSNYPSIQNTYYRSADNGMSWEEILFPLGRIYESDLLFANYRDTIILYYNDHDSLRGSTFRSDDGGANWEQINTPFVDETQAHMLSMNSWGIIIYERYKQKYSYSRDGSHWSFGDNFIDTKINIQNVYQNEKYLFAIGDHEYPTQSGYDSTVPFIKRASKTDNKWSELPTNLPNYVYPQDLVVLNNKLFLYSRASSNKSNHDGTSRVYISHDNGVTWLQVGEPLTMVNKIVLDDKYIYALGADYRGIMYRYPLSPLSVKGRNSGVVSDLNLSVYPNPATNELTISHTNGRPERMVMYDMTGALIKSGVVESETTWDVSTLASGSYMLGIPGGKMHVVQVVK